MNPETPCANHPGRKAIGFCFCCEDRLCHECMAEGPEHYYCRKPECQEALRWEVERAAEAASGSFWNNPNLRAYLVSLVETLGLAAVYVALRYLPLPTAEKAFSVDPSYFWKQIYRLNVLTLGLKPVLSGFICLEALSLILPPLNRWRLEGKAGREKLNLWAWRFSYFFAFINALGTTYLLKRIMGNFIQGPFLLFQVETIAVLVGGVALTVFLARLITRIGVGNGFLILYLVFGLYYLPRDLVENVGDYLGGKPTGNQNFVVLVMAVALVVYAAFLWRFIRRSHRIPFKSGAGKIAWFEIPPFPFSAGLQAFILTWIGTTAASLSFASIQSSWMDKGWSHLGLELAGIGLFGVLLYNWFWSIDAFGIRVGDLPRLLQKREKVLDRRFSLSLQFLLIGTALFWVPVGPDHFKSIFWFIGLADLFLYSGFFRDLWGQWRFWRAHGRGVELLEMDNMALASYLKGVLEAEKVPCHFQSYHFRMLMLWLKPLFKVRLLVPADEAPRAQKLIEQVPYQVV